MGGINGGAGRSALQALICVCAALDLGRADDDGKPAPQTRKPAPAPPPVQPTKAVPEMKCPTVLGIGVTTKREFCDILSGRTPLEGLIITLPPHRGDLTLISTSTIATPTPTS